MFARLIFIAVVSSVVALGNANAHRIQAYGRYIYSGTQNRIYNNTFSYNNGVTDTYSAQHVQAYDSGSNNWWNTTGTSDKHGYGNYWYDWANNNDTNDQNPHDGIVDWPYTIDGSAGAKDYYPLTNAPPSVPELPNPLIVVIIVAIIGVALARRNY